MKTGRRRNLVPLLAATGLLIGCAQTGPMFSQGTRTGPLKTSLSHMEFENEQLRRQVAQLKTDNRDLEDRLVQEEAVTGDLTARLNDARNLMGQQSYDPGSSTRRSRSGSEPHDAPLTLPAGRSNKTRRKPPFAQIPGRNDTTPPADPADDGADESFDPPRPRRRDDPGPQSRLEDRNHWLPIARDTAAPASKVR